MIGFAPGLYWRFCWRFAAPLFLMFIIVYGLLGYEPLSYEDYTYPTWANILGWVIAGSSVIMIPIVAIYKFLTTSGSCYRVSNKYQEFSTEKIMRYTFKRLHTLITPWRDTQMDRQANGVIQSDSKEVKLTTADTSTQPNPVEV